MKRMKYFVWLYSGKEKEKYKEIEVKDVESLPRIGEQVIFHNGGSVYHSKVFDVWHQVIVDPSEGSLSSSDRKSLNGRIADNVVCARLEKMVDYLS